MPRGVKAAPLQQAALKEFWGKPKLSSQAAQVNGSDSKTQASSSRTTLAAPPTLKRASTPPEAEPEEVADAPAIKKRRIDDSDEEDPSPTVTSSRARAHQSASPPPPKEHAKIKQQISRTSSEAEENAAAEDDEEGDEGEDEIDDDELVASRTADDVASFLTEVDIEGGWKQGQPVPYAALTHTFSLIEATTKRLEKTAILTSFFLLVIQRSAPADRKSLLQAVYLCINRLCPDYMGLELGIGESLIIKAISESTGRNPSMVKADLKKEGDLGLVAMNSKGSQRTLGTNKALTLPFVFDKLKEIASSTGHSSQNKKVALINRLLSSCQAKEFCEAKYIVRSLEGKLRIGNAEKSVLVALAHAVVLSEKEKAGKHWNKEKVAKKLEEGSEIVKSAFSELPSYDEIVPALLEVGVSGLREKCKLRPGIPLKPMLAKPTKAIGEVLDRFEGKRFTSEYKYDGERAQVHKTDDGVFSVFSRNSEDMSKKYPDLVEQLPRCLKPNTTSFVLDAEAVAVDPTSGKMLPFQELTRRKRKDVKLEDIQIKVCLQAFDLLYLNGEPLLRKTLLERRQLLREHFTEVALEFQFAKASDGETTEEIQTFLEESVKDGCEGLMVKMLETDASYYEPSRRSVNWLKLKKDYLAGVGDSLDLVVVGAYYGKGKRTNVYGAFLLACYDADSEEYQTICKIGTGFSDEMLASHYATLKPLELEVARADIKAGGAKPDIWLEPKILWEVLAADLSLSPIYTAAQGLIEERGISLRFPRFIRIRDDKSVEDATGPEQIAEMYERQTLAQSKPGKSKGKGDADDGFW
ncbi:DNA ligase I [Sistotremastrum suecicum HHB10207 ss-3]|uniref:DNA ligase n=1 Tax=Sistotremastrum suecicum HHB10207 ss-3 TaxID=1314776 RepID=A0A166EY34_9AGAM|nr:DNA ligase I [Sistotremastrum suecicum HHB10207 ss-3]